MDFHEFTTHTHTHTRHPKILSWNRTVRLAVRIESEMRWQSYSAKVKEKQQPTTNWNEQRTTKVMSATTGESSLQEEKNDNQTNQPTKELSRLTVCHVPRPNFGRKLFMANAIFKEKKTFLAPQKQKKIFCMHRLHGELSIENKCTTLVFAAMKFSLRGLLVIPRMMLLILLLLSF